MRILTTLLCLLFLAAGSILSESVNVAVREYNFGQVIAGECLEHIFAPSLTNSTEKIDTIVTSCDCLKAEVLQRSPLRIRLSWDTSDYSGFSEVYCLVFTNKRTFKFVLSAQIFSP